MSGAIVRGTRRGEPPPNPVGTAMYCLPPTLNEIGNPCTDVPRRTFQSSLPVAVSNAWNVRLISPTKVMPDAVVSTPNFTLILSCARAGPAIVRAADDVIVDIFETELQAGDITPGQGDGSEFPTALQMSDSRRSGLQALVAHEVSHQWFYSLVGNNQAQDPWLDEALATFGEANAGDTLGFLIGWVAEGGEDAARAYLAGHVEPGGSS